MVLRTGLAVLIALLGVVGAVAVPLHGSLAGTSLRGSTPDTSGAAAIAPVATGLSFDATGAPLGAHLMGEVAPSTAINFEVGLALSDPQGLGQLLSALQEPSSPSYHQFLTPEEFASTYAPSSSEEAQVSSYFLDRGATDLVVSGDRMTMNFDLPASEVASAFGTSLSVYRTAELGTFYAPSNAPSLPPTIARDLVQVDGMTDVRSGTAPSLARSIGEVPSAPASASTSPGQYDTTDDGQELFWGTDYPAVYDAQGLINSGVTGNGWSVATILWSGYNQTQGVNLPPWDPTAVDDYLQTTFPSGATLPTITPEGVEVDGTVPPPPGTYTLGDDGGGITETSLDLEMAASAAPGAHVYCFYFPGSVLTGSTSSLYGAFDQALSEALAFNYGGNGLAAVSNSYGLTETNDSEWDNLEAQAAAQGTTIFASSGDAGDAPEADTGRPQGQWPTWPATAAFQTYGTVAVGGTTIAVNGAPYSTGYNPNSDILPPMGYDANGISGLASQSVWYFNTSTSATAGSEGGISQTFNEPLFQAQSAAQSAIKLAATKEGVMYARGVPDLASVGNQTVIYDDSSGGLSGTIVGGTSVASPLMAGFMALIDEQDGRQGYILPALYAIGGYFLTQASASAADPFGGIYGVTSGANWVYNASSNGQWNPCTGWGTPEVALLAQALLDPTYTSYVYNADGVPGTAGPLPTPGPNAGVDVELVVLGAVIVVVVVIVAVLLLRPKPRQAAPGPYYGTPYGAPGGMPPPSPYSPYYAPGPAQPGAYAYGYGAAQPPPLGSNFGPYAAAPGYAAPVYPQPSYGAPQGYVYQPHAPAPTYVCRYCRNPRPYTNSPCPSCGGPL